MQHVTVTVGIESDADKLPGTRVQLHLPDESEIEVFYNDETRLFTVHLTGENASHVAELVRLEVPKLRRV